MAKKKPQQFKIASEASSSAPVIDAKSISGKVDDKVSVNLRYYQKNYECFSKWRGGELKAFSNFVEKMAIRTKVDVTKTTGTCHAHKGVTKALPVEVSEDVKMYCIDVGPKQRVHGFFCI